MSNNLLQFPAPAGPAPDALPSDAPAREAALDIRSSCIVEAPAGSGKTGLLMQRFLRLLADEHTQRPEEVLAITFTNKATTELRNRVLEQLQTARGVPFMRSTSRMNGDPQPPAVNGPATTPGAPSSSTALSSIRVGTGEAGAATNLDAEETLSPFDHQTRLLAQSVLHRDGTLHWNLLDRPQSLNIRTIDSVCAEIANSLPLLSGSGGNRTPTTDAFPLYRLAAQRTLFQLGTPPLHDDLRTVLLHRDASLTDVESLLANMLAGRDQWAALVPLGPEALDDATLDRDVRAQLERTLENIVCTALTRAAALMPPGMLHELAALAAQLGLNPGYKGDASPIAFCASLNTPPAEAADHLDHWQALISLLLTEGGTWRKTLAVNALGFEMNKAEKASLQHLIDTHKSDALCDALCAVRNLPPAKYPDEQWAVAKALFRVLRHALAELRLLFAERNECDFTEISLAASHALHSDDADTQSIDAALAAGGHLRHLLVDEMQDTSASQYDLIHQLTRTWDGVSQTLFLVGDPKQSIYLFRQARVERFLRTMHSATFGDIRLQALRLTSNFRSQGALVRSVNRTFECIFVPATASDVPFVAAIPTRPAADSDSIVWHPAILGEEKINTGSPQRDHEAQQAIDIRHTIESWLDKPLPANRTKPWRIAVLARARKHLTAIVAEFKRDRGHGALAYRAVDIDSLAGRPEVFDALALTRALLHPADRVAWLAVLHAPWCGLSLSDLLALTNEGPTADPTATVATLVATRANLLSDEGRQLLARAWPVLEAAVASAGTSPVSTQVARTWRSLGGDVSLQPGQRRNVLRFLEVLAKLQSDLGYIDLTALDARLAQLYAEPATTQCQVELLTIHKAKGLEWDVVLVPSLEKRGASNSSDLLNWLEIDSSDDRAAGVLLAPIGSKGSETNTLNKWLNSAKETRENAERKRLFYVLATRAREELHLFGAVERKTSGELCPPTHGSLLKAICPAAEPIFAPLQQQPAQQLPLPGSLAEMLRLSLNPSLIEHVLEPLALAAGADASPAPQLPPLLHRLPLSFNLASRFTAAAAERLPYTPAAALRPAHTSDRPEGSFAVRAFGNVVHRYLQLLATRLESTPNPDALQADPPTWLPRLTASLRSEGLAPTAIDALAKRALAALHQSLTDPTGRWILSPHPASTTEQALAQQSGELRIDRTFLAGPTTLSAGESHLWIIDFKTTEQGSRSPELFLQQERQKYVAQLENYAHALSSSARPTMLGLYYPLVPRLIFWAAPATT